MDKYLTTQEAAAALGVSRQRFYILAKRNGISSAGRMSEKGKQGRRTIWLSGDITRLADAHRRRLALLTQARQIEIEEPA